MYNCLSSEMCNAQTSIRIIFTIMTNFRHYSDLTQTWIGSQYCFIFLSFAYCLSFYLSFILYFYIRIHILPLYQEKEIWRFHDKADQDLCLIDTKITQQIKKKSKKNIYKTLKVYPNKDNRFIKHTQILFFNTEIKQWTHKKLMNFFACTYRCGLRKFSSWLWLLYISRKREKNKILIL